MRVARKKFPLSGGGEAVLNINIDNPDLIGVYDNVAAKIVLPGELLAALWIIGMARQGKNNFRIRYDHRKKEIVVDAWRGKA